ncbi:MAG: hypothetical protein GC149_17370 [Gammaproteobacteria bacterium]|nr:hypothetical protein [Gammaproteobacteria bacterium]
MKLSVVSTFKMMLKKIVGRHIAHERRDWAICVYFVDNPLSADIKFCSESPSILGDNVSDVNAAFVADPFLVQRGENEFYLFYEIFNTDTNKGEIAFSKSTDGTRWEYQKVILSENYHLSYPYVFRSENDYFMIPESSQDYSVKLYKAVEFPAKWEYVKTLLSGYHFADASIFKHKGYWWLFVSTRENDTLNLYYADSIYGPWSLHKKSPLIRNNLSIARPGGRVVEIESKLYRIAQNCNGYYGKNISIFEIVEISTDEYKEKLVNESFLKESNKGSWNSKGMHHMDCVKVADRKWLVSVDGFGNFGRYG